MTAPRRASGVALGLLFLAGCASLPPAEDRALREAQAFADATTWAYGVSGVRVVARRQAPGIGATFRRGVIALQPAVLSSPFVEVVMAHELGHAVLAHEGPVPLEAAQTLTQRELDANAMAVDILMRVKGLRQAEALGRVVEFLWSVQSALATGPPAQLPVGHPPPCYQVEDLLRRFPAHRPALAFLGCAGHTVP